MIPSDDTLKTFIRENQPVVVSKIARQFNIKRETGSDLVKVLLSKNEIVVEKIGSYKFVKLPE